MSWSSNPALIYSEQPDDYALVWPIRRADN